MKEFNVTFWRWITHEVLGNKKELRRVTGVKAKTETAARNKAFRKICFATKYDHWEFLNIKEAV